MFLDTEDVNLYYEVKGEGEPLLLVHGVVVDAGLYDEAAKLLAKQYKVITYDRRGSSRSTVHGENVKYDVDTQEELCVRLNEAGYKVTQATVSRDIRELKLTKISTDNGRQKYAVITDADSNMMEKYARVLREGFLSVDAAENIVVIKTVSGMAGAVAAAVDAMRMQEIVGSLAGDDTILCVIRTSDDAVHIMKKLRKIVEQ